MKDKNFKLKTKKMVIKYRSAFGGWDNDWDFLGDIQIFSSPAMTVREQIRILKRLIEVKERRLSHRERLMIEEEHKKWLLAKDGGFQ